MIKILLLFVTLFFSFNLRVDASLCDQTYIDGLKEMAEQVEVNYEYLEDSIDNRYYITVYLTNAELNLKYQGDYYYYNDFNKGKIGFTVDSGVFEFSIHSSNCYNFRLKSFSYNLPKFNIYSKSHLCQSLIDDNVDICDPWYQGYLDYDLFKKKIAEYTTINQNKDSNYKSLIYNFFVIFLIIGILVCFVIYLIYKRRRSVLE